MRGGPVQMLGPKPLFCVAESRVGVFRAFDRQVLLNGAQNQTKAPTELLKLSLKK